jgi:GrpB-like predicted nucleotidyltransferase (UPF0157 family)
MPSDEKVEVVPYDPAWLGAFEAERDRLRRAIASYLTGTIEHVGSTSVPGLAAKPIVDIQIGVASLSESRSAFGPLEALGYRSAPFRPDVMHFLEKRRPGEQPCNVQLIPYLSDCWKRRIAFRDYLRTHARVAEEYAALKQRLARESVDRAAYGRGKDPFIRSVTERAHHARPTG